MLRMVCFTFICSLLSAGVYDPQAPAEKNIQDAVTKAKADGKHVLIQVGGNWCPWCLKLEKFFSTTPEVKKQLDENYILLFVNYSKENKNLKVLQSLDYPQRFGFPVLIVLDGTGKRLHTQNTVYLEKDKGYSEKEVLSFLKSWNPEALDPETYK